MIPFLRPHDPFPAPETASPEFGGLLAAGGDLEPERILQAYRAGIFPWGTIEGHPLWYAPDPRMVLFPAEFRLRRSLRKTLRSGRFTLRFDHDFAATIAACASTPRRGQDGTWISAEMQSAYCRLHELGWAHSVEAWCGGDLAGGLYGLAIGGMFYGESMFAHQPDASKAAFAYLIHHLREHCYGMIDCQMYTEHLASLGGREIPRKEFLSRLRVLAALPAKPGKWPAAPANLPW